MSTVPPPAPSEKEGMSCLAVGGIGCLIVIVALFVGGGALLAQWKSAMEEYTKNAASNPDKAAAMLGIKMLPKVEVVREDDTARTITFKVPGGEELTMHYDGLSQGKGRPRVTNSKGEDVDMSRRKPGAAPASAPQAAPSAPAPVSVPNN